MLSDHDLRQIDESYLDSLSERELREISKKLCHDLKAARARLNQNPDNSSRPPSTRAPWEQAITPEQDTPADNGKTDTEKPAQSQSTEKGKGKNVSAADNKQSSKSSDDDAPKSSAPRKKPGKQEGAQGHGRKVELAVTHEKHHKPHCCSACSQAFDDKTEFSAWNGRYELELELGETGLAGLRVQHIKHVYYQAICRCGHKTRVEPGRCEAEPDWSVGLTEWHMCGPNLVSLIVCMSKELHASRPKISNFMQDWLGIHLSIGVINQCIHEAGRAVEPVVREQLIPELVKSKLLYIDETPWKQVKLILWLWVFVSNTTVVFGMGKRNREMLLSVLGEEFEGILMSDGLGAYRDSPNRLRCWAHLIRKARGLAQSLDKEAQSFGENVLVALYLLMRNIYNLRDGPPDNEVEAICRHNLVLCEMLRQVCELHQEHEHEVTRSLAREFLNDWDAIVRVVVEPELPLTNNEAERALRPWVILRKITFGTRNAQGTQVVALLASVIATCRVRSLNPWRYLAEVIQQRRVGGSAPVMPLPAI